MRSVAGRAKRALFPSAEMAAWRQACRVAERVPRFTPGEIDLAGYRIGYTDLLSVCPQWHDLFVRESLRFECRAPAPRILDCGANVGLASLYFKRLYPDARITAYEAEGAVARVARANLARNGAADVDVHEAAVWTDNGVVEFRSEGADSGAIEGTSVGASGHVSRVAAVRLADVLARERVHLLKLDIEGAEGAVLRDCEPMLGNVDAMLLDLHEFDPARRQTPAVLALLERAGFAYTLSELVGLPWRGTIPSESAFGGRPNVWAMLVRAWKTRP